MIRIVSHDPAWVENFAAEARRVAQAVREAAVRIHHIGSTAVPRTQAKPVIDLLLEVASLEAIDANSSALEALGYEAMGEFGITGRRYFRRDDAAGTRTHQVHAYRAGAPDVRRHLAFRDYLRAHPAVAEEYGALKLRLATAFPDDSKAYVNGKDAFVKHHESCALRWARAWNGNEPDAGPVA